MKVQIRKGVFETNSSSVHSITMCTSKEWEDWIMGRTMFMPDDCKFLSVKEAEEYNCELAEKEGTDFSDPYSVSSPPFRAWPAGGPSSPDGK